MQNIKTLAVLGAGTMGCGITQVLAECGYSVFLRDVNQELADTGLERIKRSLQKLVERSKTTEDKVAEIWSRITLTTDIHQAVADADFVIEAITEKLELKKELFKAIEKFGKANLILATNTSTLSITELGSFTDMPQRFIGMHFMNPVPLMSLIEIVTGLLTSPETIKATGELAISLGKEPIIVKDSPGFATTRLGVALFMEASRMLEEGVASVRDIDKAMRLGYGHRMGPFETCDLVGLDSRLNNINSLYESTRDSLWKPPQILKKLISAGFLGKKPYSKGGYYQYFTPT